MVNMTQTSLRIDSDLWKWLKIEAVINDMSTNELICKVLAEYKEKTSENN